MTLYRHTKASCSSLTRNRIRFASHNVSFDQLAEQTPLQRRAFELLDLNPSRLWPETHSTGLRIPLGERDPAPSGAKTSG